MRHTFSFRKWFARLLGVAGAPRRGTNTRQPYRLTLEQLESRLTPTSTLSIADSSVLEPTPHGTVNLDFTVTRTGDLSSQLTVGYTTVAGTAQPQTDFTPTTGTTTFASGSATATIGIPVFNNGIYENPSLTFAVKLTGVVNVVGPSVSLATPQAFATGTQPFSVAVGDLNGDGKPDLVVANYSANTVSVLLNTTPRGASTPSFAPPQTFATGSKPISVALTDLNGDGKPDIVAVNVFGNTVSVLLNTTLPGAATASFAPQQTFATGVQPLDVAVGDLNGDGKPDLLVANYNVNTVSVLLNTTAPGATTASFAPQQTFATGASPRAVAVGDLNGDGKPDLLVVNKYSDTVSVLLNTTPAGASKATFAAQQTVTTGFFPITVTVGDLNGDGKPDIVAANYIPNTMSVMLNMTPPGATTLSFATQHTFATGIQPQAVVLGDVNGDGKPDLLVANYSDNTVSVLLNTTAPGATAPSFAPQQTFATGTGPRSLALVDLNEDGKPDLLVVNEGTDTVSVLLNTTLLGATTAPAFSPTALATGTKPVAVARGDLNGDGKPDLVVANKSANTVSVLLNTTPPGASTPSFATQQTFATGVTPFSVALGDVNGDGKPDLLVANYGSATVSVLLNTTPPGATRASFATQQTFATGGDPFSVSLADVNGDGKPDLVVTNKSDNTVSVLLNTTAPGAATPSFAPQQTFATGRAPVFVALGDVNGDGKPDLVVVNVLASTVSVLLNTTLPGATKAAFATQQTFATGGTPFSVALADVNGDGLPDLLVADYSSNAVSVLLNTTVPGKTTASFAAQQTFATGTGPESVAVGDLNGDGKPDLLVANYSANTVSVLLNTTLPGASTATFAPQHTFATGTGPQAVILGDVNGDGLPDLIAANYKANTVSVLLNTPVTIARGMATGTITETNPPPTVQFAAASESVNENAGKFSITVTLSSASSLATTIPFALGGTAVSGTNYSGVTASPLVFAAGSSSVNITGTLIDDHLFETSNRTLTLTLGKPTNATLGTTSTNTLTITESDAEPTVQFAAASETLSASAGTFSLTVTLSSASGATTTIPFALGGSAVAGIDVSGVSASPLVIGAGQTSGTITGTLLAPTIFGGGIPKTLTVALGTPTNATLGATTTNTLTISKITPRPNIPNLTPQERYIQALYLNELGRPGTQAELDAWLPILNGPGGAAAVVSEIQHSAEATDFLVRSWYPLYLGRAPQNGEELPLAMELQQGQTEEMVLSQLLGMPEFYARSQVLVSSGTADQRFVQNLYEQLLGRSGDSTEVAYWVNQVPQLGRQGIALQFLQSQAFRNNIVESYYNVLLHRFGTPAEVNYWVNSGEDLATVRANFETTTAFMSGG